MHWHELSINAYAAFERACGAELRLVNGQWWRRVAPFFFRPLNPLEKIPPQPSCYPSQSRWGGIQHAVPDPRAGNCYMNFFIYENLQDYDLSQLDERRRRETCLSLNHFRAELIPDWTTFRREAYPVYWEFYNRTGYNYRKQRLNPKGFTQWARALFAFPEIQVLGVYHQSQLVAVNISYRLGDVIFDDTLFSNNFSLKLHVTNFILHTLRAAAAQSDARWLNRGGTTTRRSLDQSKVLRGCRMVAMPARLKANPLALIGLRLFRAPQYRRLLGVGPSMLPGRIEARLWRNCPTHLETH